MTTGPGAFCCAAGPARTETLLPALADRQDREGENARDRDGGQLDNEGQGAHGRIPLVLVIAVCWVGVSVGSDETGGGCHNEHRVEGDRDCGPLDHHGHCLHGSLSFGSGRPGLAFGPVSQLR